MEQWETDLIAAVRELSRGAFTERATRHDREGSFPAENIVELKKLGVVGMALPKDIGGLGISPTAQTRIMEEVAYGDGSTAVALNMHLLIADLLNSLPPFPRRNTVLADIGKNNVLICGPGSIPSGDLDNRTAGYKAREDGDDLVFNGKSGFASGSDGAKYAIMPALIDRGEGAEPDIAFAIPELSTPGLKVMHNWDAMGLRSTASHDIVAEEMRVPRGEAMVIPLPMLRAIQEAQGAVTSPATQNRAKGALGITAIWLGLAQAAFDFSLDYVARRHGYLAGPSTMPTASAAGYRSEQAWAQFGIGNMEHWLETGRTILYDTTRRLDDTFENPQAFIRLLVRTVYHLRRMSEEVSQGAMKVCGAHAYVRDRPLERIFRDMVGGNVMAWKTDELQLSLGVAALGQPITFVGPAGT
jgi:alkylation response protein AidB-like acyl-CoA dehydrogenase